MFKRKRPLSKLQGLAAKWRVWSKMLIAFARQITLAHKQDAHCGIRKAELLEAALYTATCELSRDIAEATAEGEPRSKAEALDLQYLKAMYVSLSVITLMISALRRDLEMAAEKLAMLAGAPRLSDVIIPAAPATDLGFLDSS